MRVGFGDGKAPVVSDIPPGGARADSLLVCAAQLHSFCVSPVVALLPSKAAGMIQGAARVLLAKKKKLALIRLVYEKVFDPDAQR